MAEPYPHKVFYVGSSPTALTKGYDGMADIVDLKSTGEIRPSSNLGAPTKFHAYIKGM